MNNNGDGMIMYAEDTLGFFASNVSLFIAVVAIIGLVIVFWRLSGKFWLSALGVVCLTAATYEITYRLSNQHDEVGQAAFTIYQVLETGRIKVSIWSEDERFRQPIEDAVDRGRRIMHPEPRGE